MREQQTGGLVKTLRGHVNTLHRVPSLPRTASQLPTPGQLPKMGCLLFGETKQNGPSLGTAEGKSETSHHTEKGKYREKSTS